MDNTTLRMIVENYIFALEGDRFQNFCDRLCIVLYPDDYTPVRAAGPNGDGKNDGYCPKARVFFQAHATRGEKLSKTKKKISEDLDGCLKKQRDVKTWIYLTNDTLCGEIEQFIDLLRTQYENLTIETWGHKKITNKIMSLEKDKLEQIISLPLNLTEYEIKAEVDKYEFSIVDTIFRNIINNNNDGRTYRYKENIKLEKKIKINFPNKEVQKIVSQHFRYAFIKYKRIEERMQQESPETQNDLHADILSMYRNFLKYGKSGEDLLNALFEYYTPKEYAKNESYRNLAKAYVLFFFEDCTIFEQESLLEEI